MADFVHLTPARFAAQVRRGGISARGARRVVYLAPVLPSYTLTHQWSRELRRHRPGPMVAVDVRLPDDLPVWAGHYAAQPVLVTAARAVALARELEDARGFEVFVPHRIPASQVRRVRTLTRPVGWRYLPDAHGRRPCACPVCLQPGTYGVAGIRRRFSPDPPPRAVPAIVADLPSWLNRLVREFGAA